MDNIEQSSHRDDETVKSNDEVAVELQDREALNDQDSQKEQIKEDVNPTTSVGDNEGATVVMEETSLSVITNQINLLETEEADDTVSQPTSTKAMVPPISVICGQIKQKRAGFLICQHESTLEFEVQLKEFEDCICTAENPQLRSPLRQSSKKLKVQKMKEIKKLVLEAGLTQNEESRNVVFKHCSKCGSAIFKNYVGVKPENNQTMSPNKVPAMLMLTSMFNDQAEFEQLRVNGRSCLEQVAPSELLEYRVALLYMNRRDELVSNIYRLGRKFKQRTRTIHVAATLMDNFFLNKRAQNGIRCLDVLSGRCFSIFCTTFFLIASKFDEIDDRLVFIKDVQDYYRSININRNSRSEDLIPSWDDIVECERLVMGFFEWNINFSILSPLMFLEAFLAFGNIVRADCMSETREKSISQVCRDLEAQAYQTLDFMLEKRVALSNVLGACRGHQVAALAIYKARKNLIEVKRLGDVLGEVWPLELRIITRMSTSEIEHVQQILSQTQTMVNEMIMSERGRQLLNEAEAPRIIRGNGGSASKQRSDSRSNEIAKALAAAKAGPFRKKKIIQQDPSAAQLPDIKKPCNEVIAERVEEHCETQTTEVAVDRDQADRRAEINKALQAARQANGFRIKKNKNKSQHTLQQSQSTMLTVVQVSDEKVDPENAEALMERVDVVRPPSQQLCLPGLRAIPGTADGYQTQLQAPASARAGETWYATQNSGLPKTIKGKLAPVKNFVSPSTGAFQTLTTIGVHSQSIRKPSIQQTTDSVNAIMQPDVKSARTKPSDEASLGSKQPSASKQELWKDAREKSSGRVLAAAQHMVTQKAKILLQKQSSTQQLRPAFGGAKGSTEFIREAGKRGVRSLSKMPDQLPDMKFKGEMQHRLATSRQQSTVDAPGQKRCKEPIAALKLFKLNLSQSQHCREREDSHSDRELASSVNKCLRLESIMKQRPSQEWNQASNQRAAPSEQQQPNKLKSRVFSMDLIDYKSSCAAANRHPDTKISTESIMLKDVCSKLRLHGSDEKPFSGAAEIKDFVPAAAQSGAETARTGGHRKDCIELVVQRDSSSKQSTQNTSVQPAPAVKRQNANSQVSDVAIEQLHALMSGSVGEDSYQASSDEKIKCKQSQQLSSNKKLTFMNRATRHERLLRGASKIDLSEGEKAGLSSETPRMQQFHTTRGSEVLDAARLTQLKTVSLLAQSTEQVAKQSYLGVGKKSQTKLMSQEACRIQSSSLMRGQGPRLSLQGRTGMLNLNGLRQQQQQDASSSGKPGVPQIWRKAAPPATLTKHLPEAFRTQREKTFLAEGAQHTSVSSTNIMSNTARKNMLRLKRRGRGVETSSSTAKIENGRSTTARKQMPLQGTLAPSKNERSGTRRIPEPAEQYLGIVNVADCQKALNQSKSFAKLNQQSEAQYFACTRHSRKDQSRLRVSKLASIDCTVQPSNKSCQKNQLSLMKESKSLSHMNTINVAATCSSAQKRSLGQHNQSHLQAVVAKQKRQRPFTYKLEDAEHAELIKVLSELSPVSPGQVQQTDKALA